MAVHAQVKWAFYTLMKVGSMSRMLLNGLSINGSLVVINIASLKLGSHEVILDFTIQMSVVPLCSLHFKSVFSYY